jgi:Protein of unknown function (DUF998)
MRLDMTTLTSVQFSAPIAEPATSTTRPTRWLALGAVAGPLLFTFAWSVLGLLSPGYILFDTLIAPYSPISQPVSGLGLGPTGPFMNAAFVLSGLLLAVGVLGGVKGIESLGTVQRWSCALLLLLSPLGAVMDGMFTLESPMLHLVGFLLATATPIFTFPVAGVFLGSIPHWRRFGSWLLLGSPVTLALLILFFLTFSPSAEGATTGVAGLTQRILVLEVQAWFVAMGWLAFRRS